MAVGLLEQNCARCSEQPFFTGCVGALVDELAGLPEQYETKHTLLTDRLETKLREQGGYLRLRRSVEYKGHKARGEVDVLRIRCDDAGFAYDYFEVKPSAKYRVDASDQVNLWRRYMHNDCGIPYARLGGYFVFPAKDDSPIIEPVLLAPEPIPFPQSAFLPSHA